MTKLIADYFDRLARIEGPVLTDISGPAPRGVWGTELPDVLDRMAAELARQGLRPGDRVIALFDNTLESALLLLTALRYGITLCLQPTGASAAEIETAEALAATTGRLNATGRPLHDLAPLRFEELRSAALTPPDVPLGTPFTVTFTSGSTGIPKGIVHAAESFLACAEAFNRQTGITHADRFLNIMPMYYMAGVFNGILAPLQAGAPVVIDAAFGTATALRLWSLIRDNGITATWLSPTMLSLAMRLDRTDKTLPPGFRRLFVGTGAMARADAVRFYETYGLAPQQSYGLSELLYISVDDAETPHFGTVGQLLDGVRIGFDGSDALAVASPYTFLGYLEAGEIEAPATPFITSDLGKQSDGVLSIVGRSDDIILRGGVNVNPVELETLLSPMLRGRGFCLTGLPDETLGQKVVLVMEGSAQPDDRETLAAAQILVRDKGGRAQIDELARVAAIPLGPTGKIRRSALRAELVGGTA